MIFLSREDTSVSPRDRLELSDYVESKVQKLSKSFEFIFQFFEVREMMAKEGVVLDFSDTKLKGWPLFTMNQNLTKPTTKVEL